MKNLQILLKAVTARLLQNRCRAVVEPVGTICDTVYTAVVIKFYKIVLKLFPSSYETAL